MSAANRVERALKIIDHAKSLSTSPNDLADALCEAILIFSTFQSAPRAALGSTIATPTNGLETMPDELAKGAPS